MSDLTTEYLGLGLRTPLVASAGPLTRDPEAARRLEAAGVSALVMPSLFEEEILHEETSLTRALEAGAEHFAEALDYFPDPGDYPTVRDRYAADVERLKAAVDIPVIASLNAASPGSWVSYAHLVADAGADAVELNLYRVAADPAVTAADVEETDLAVVAEVSRSLPVPVALKLSPYYSSFANFARRAVEAGAAGLVLFNRFYQPDLDLDDLAPVPRITLSHPDELRLPLRWLAILRPLVDGRASLAATSGVWSGADVVKALLVGADVAMMTSALLHHGPDHVAVVEALLAAWLEERGYTSVAEARGSVSYATSDDPGAFERANYLAMLHSWGAPHRLTPSSPSA